MRYGNIFDYAITEIKKIRQKIKILLCSHKHTYQVEYGYSQKYPLDFTITIRDTICSDCGKLIKTETIR